ncbi:unnamed protein product [Clonostachys rosea]|uniref:Glucose-methanol-choline oxidoreductase N-terminal domain-containing protein n=1 Tax=Bionectria ochroleuca TaxID=29856 RepID=A0ABY6TNX2_BIOOC|nr:unnamed protein product [Clonostachys rosea]
MSSPNAEYDFIIVGAGPAGCAVAQGISSSLSNPSVCLVEAGGTNEDVNQRIAGNMFVQMLNPAHTSPYESTPQKHMYDRKISLVRGTGLGGSSAVNFMAWTIGPRDDWAHVSELTGDPDWNWTNAKRRFRALETYHDAPSELPKGAKKYLNPNKEDHGYQGPLHIGFEDEWDEYTTSVLDIWAANGYEINPDSGSGDPIGFSVCPKTTYNGTRVTADDLLYSTSKNLEIRTGSPVHKVLFKNKRAIGIILVDGTILHAKKEVILSAGALDTPKILMHSGIGPSEQLARYGIETLVNSKQVGQNYKDHYHVQFKYGRAERTNRVAAFFRDPDRQVASLREWKTYRTGEYANYGTSMNVGFFKCEAVLRSKEFRALPAEEQSRLKKPTVPTYEISTAGIAPEYYTDAHSVPPLLTFTLFVHNSQGKGSVELASADPTVPLDFKPAFMVHPYDQRVIIEATREFLKVTKSAAFKEDEHPTTPEYHAPASDSEEDILDFWRKNCGSTWHMSGTCRMGRRGDDGAVVNSQLLVNGVTGLRVADLGVMPIIASAHTQSTAYQVGLTAAEKIIAQHSLNARPAL